MVNPYTLHSHCQTLHVCLNTRVFLTIDEARLWKGDLKTSHKQCRPIKLRVNAYFYTFPMICCGHLMLQSKCLKERGYPLVPPWHFGCTSCNFKRRRLSPQKNLALLVTRHLLSRAISEAHILLSERGCHTRRLERKVKRLCYRN